MKKRTPGGIRRGHLPDASLERYGYTVLFCPVKSALMQGDSKFVTHLIRQNKLKTYWEGQVQLQAFLTSTLDIGE